jgi:hypothetical protein
MTRQVIATAGRDSALMSGLSSGRTRVRRGPTTIEPGEAAVLDCLADILVGDTTWTLGEVQDLLALHARTVLGNG